MHTFYQCRISCTVTEFVVQYIKDAKLPVVCLYEQGIAQFAYHKLIPNSNIFYPTLSEDTAKALIQIIHGFSLLAKETY